VSGISVTIRPQRAKTWLRFSLPRRTPPGPTVPPRHVPDHRPRPTRRQPPANCLRAYPAAITDLAHRARTERASPPDHIRGGQVGLDRWTGIDLGVVGFGGGAWPGRFGGGSGAGGDPPVALGLPGVASCGCRSGFGLVQLGSHRGGDVGLGRVVFAVTVNSEDLLGLRPGRSPKGTGAECRWVQGTVIQPPSWWLRTQILVTS
jgi:hypothetical protein